MDSHCRSVDDCLLWKSPPLSPSPPPAHVLDSSSRDQPGRRPHPWSSRCQDHCGCQPRISGTSLSSEGVETRPRACVLREEAIWKLSQSSVAFNLKKGMWSKSLANIFVLFSCPPLWRSTWLAFARMRENILVKRARALSEGHEGSIHFASPAIARRLRETRQHEVESVNESR